MQKIECSYCQKIYRPKPKDGCGGCGRNGSCQTTKCPYCGYPAVEALKSGEKASNSVMRLLKSIMQ